jgi:hypothetical protein
VQLNPLVLLLRQQKPKVNNMELGFVVLVSKLPHTGMQFISKDIVRTKGSHEEKNHVILWTWRSTPVRASKRQNRQFGILLLIPQ